MRYYGDREYTTANKKLKINLKHQPVFFLILDALSVSCICPFYLQEIITQYKEQHKYRNYTVVLNKMAGDDESTGSGKATHYEDYDWKELSDEVKKAAEVLGYDKKVSKQSYSV
jgi:hypothetical protein